MARGNEQKSNDTHWQTRFNMETVLVLDGQWWHCQWKSLTLTHWLPENGKNIFHVTHDEMETVLDGQRSISRVKVNSQMTVVDFLRDSETYTSVYLLQLRQTKTDTTILVTEF